MAATVPSTIEVTQGATIATGPHAVRLFQLLALQGALRLEELGLKRRGRSALSIAQETTGLRTRNRASQISAVQKLVDEARTHITYVEERI